MELGEALVERSHLLGVRGSIVALLAVLCFCCNFKVIPTSVNNTQHQSRLSFSLLANKPVDAHLNQINMDKLVKWCGLTLMLPLPHTLGSSRSHHSQVGNTGQKNGSNGGQNRPPVIRVQNAGDPSGTSGPKRRGGAGIGQGENDGDGSLHGEVDGEDLGHEGGELRAGEDLEGDDASYEGLEREKVGEKWPVSMSLEETYVEECCPKQSAITVVKMGWLAIDRRHERGGPGRGGQLPDDMIGTWGE